MTRPRYPSDELRAKIKPHFRAHLSMANHPKTVAVYADNDLLATWLRLGMLGVERGAAHTSDKIYLSRADVERTSGRRRADVAGTLLERLANVLGWSIERHGDVTVIHFRNLGTKQGFTPRLRAETPRSSAGLPMLPSPRPHSPSLRAENAPNGDPVKGLFDAGVALLTRHGVPERDARAIVGRLRKHHRDEQAHALILKAAKMTDPREWLCATLKEPSERPYSPC